MAYDKIVDSEKLDALLTDIADAVREKTETTEKIADTELAAAVRNMQTGEDLSEELKAQSDKFDEINGNFYIGDVGWYAEDLSDKEILQGHNQGLDRLKTDLAYELDPEGIAAGWNICGVDGVYSNEFTIPVEYRPAGNSDILEGCAAFLNGEMIIGELQDGSMKITEGIVYHEIDSAGALVSATVYGEVVPNKAFYNNTSLERISLVAPIKIAASAFANCPKLVFTELPASLQIIMASSFYNCPKITSITFKGTPTTMYATVFSGCTNLLTINVPWAEGEVANAPWGATNATINYNYTGE